MSSGNPTVFTRIRDALGLGDTAPVDQGLTRINERLGLNRSQRDYETRKPADIHVERTDSHPRSLFFAPDIDGQADSGEVVWVWAPSDGKQAPPRERAVLLIGRTHTTVLGLLISANPEHGEEDNWLEIGAGEWDESGRQCWIRLDRILEVSEEEVRRQGTLFPERRFQRIANRLRSRYHWA
ncbi:PemK-like protein [Corynebacterium camporealensis]|uniref:PemK-like protein n=1 Tax=Corynebacterium camporealensis TaxID=161896 RepID=A0A0F6TC44_9CORY|nr:type II toxin-antitoxin system PemK/MazF family toxin [Corynebacterium camporealensis]AKE39686.1 PemK-like protein [Corynebacterium camporealensis]AVH88814.1 PemK-like protein [Corynebacterium camporealensis]